MLDRRSERVWPCPRCGAESGRDPDDGYQRRCPECGYRGAFETFTPKLTEGEGQT
jgi:DNA-directed RNA polymerase subunit RPC12/RpoP